MSEVLPRSGTVPRLDRTRFLALSFLADGILGLVALVMPGSGDAYRLGLLGISTFGIVVGLAIVAFRSYLSGPICEVLVLIGSALLALGIIAVGSRSPDAAALETFFATGYTGSMLYALMFFPRSRALLQVAAGAALYFGALVHVGRGSAALPLVVLQTLGGLGIAVTVIRYLAIVGALCSQDDLTELPNRETLRVQADHALATAVTQQRGAGLLLLDLNGFKEINDTRGHDTGDQVLRTIARRLEWAFGKNDGVTRLGGDEFVVLVADRDDPDAVRAEIQTVRRVLGAPVALDNGDTVAITVAVGCAVASEDDHDFASLLRAADSDMYRDKDVARRTQRVVDVTESAARTVGVNLAPQSQDPQQSEDDEGWTSRGAWSATTAG
jgi:diguanylate cyclase (GGDEF)-like protein